MDFATLPSTAGEPWCGPGPTPADLWTRWTVDPVTLAGLATLCAVLTWRVASGRAGAWPALGLAASVAALYVGPFCALGSALFSARAAHHLALLFVVGPLAAAVWPARGDGRPVLAVGASIAATVLWHWPPAYGLALRDDVAFWAMQASLALSSVLLWRAARRASPLVGAAAVTVASLGMGLVGAVLTFAPRALYAPHAHTTQAWGLSPLDDQALAGLILWAPGAGLALVGALILSARALKPAPP